MSKLFVFAIGGTGSRVLRAVTMLMAAGLKIKASRIIPVIIDPDSGNCDLTRTIDCLNDYKFINESLSKDGESKGFFSSPVENIFSKYDFRMDFRGVDGRLFKEYIDYAGLDKNNKAFAELLFSDYHLDLNMDVGFKGNPNLGSIVLDQFSENDDFKKFALNYSQGDRIFIISSIHGGTGAAGFPLLLKNILNPGDELPNKELIKESVKGAITVLPYFKLQAGEINSSDFTSKTKAALEYYYENVNPGLNSLYYIGYKDHTKSYENNPGGVNQKNPAHFVELAAALSLFDFMEQKDEDIKPGGKRFLEFGADISEERITFDELDDSIKKYVRKPLSKFAFFSKYLDLQIEKSITGQPWGMRGSEKTMIGKEFLDTDYYKRIKIFNKHFKNWMSELSVNSPAFTPFNLKANEENLTYMINKRPVEKKPYGKDNFVLFDDHLNECERQDKVSKKPANLKFTNLFHNATDRFVTKNFKI